MCLLTPASGLSQSRFKSLNDVNSNHYFLFNAGTRWLSFWLDFMAATMTLMVALFAVLSDIDQGSKGLALSYTIQVNLSGESHIVSLWRHTESSFNVQSYIILLWGWGLQLTGMLQFVVRTATEVEARFNSVERLLEYTKVRSKSSVLLCIKHFLVCNILIA